MIKKLSFLTLFFLCPLNVFAGISGVTIQDGAFSISGNSLGTILKQAEWTGDNIESGTVGAGFTKTPWNNFYLNKATYTDADKHSGAKSILFDFKSTTSRAIIYDFGENISEAYLTAWVKIVKKDDSDTFQWKNWRIKDTNDYNAQTAIVGDNWHYNTDGWGNTSVVVIRDTFWDQDSKRTVTSDGFLIGEWQRLEAHYKKSDTGVANGSFEWRRVGRAGSEVIVSNYVVITHDATNADQLWRYIMVGHFYGNLQNADGSAYTGTRDCEIYYDDIYVSQSRKRVEIGNNAVFANCTHREIQPALTWSDTGITGTFNQGSFETGDTVYFFVIDENGVPSDGYPVTIGGEATIASPVVEILTESGQITTASIFTITGTATADTGQTISGVICSGQTVTPDDGVWDEQEESWTCSVVDLVLGPNVLEFIATDSEGQTGSDSVTVTRTQPGYSTRGSGYTIKGCSLK